MAKASMRAVAHGHVQGVFFRQSVQETARRLGLTGYVRNLPTGKDVEVQAEGDKDRIDELVRYLQVGPPSANVEKTVVTWEKYSGEYNDFSVRP